MKTEVISNNREYLVFDDIGIQEALKKIFTAMLISPDIITDAGVAERKNEIYKRCCGLFFNKFPVNIFFEEYYFIYQVFKHDKVRIFNINQLRSLINTNAQDILKTPFIELTNINKLDNGNIVDDDEKIQLFTENMVELVTSLSNKVVSDVDFESACEQYLEAYKTELIKQASYTMTMIIQSTGYDEKLIRGGRKHWQGKDDAIAYFNKKLAIVRELDEENSTKVIHIDNEYVYSENEKDLNGEDEGETLMDYGIAEMDEVCLGLRRTNMIEMMGPPKGGKTTFTGYLVERALSKGLNVAIWPLEGKYTEWMALIETLTVAHFESGAMQLNRGKVLLRKYANVQERQAVATARTLLASRERGNLTFIEGSAYVEDFLDVLKNHYENENAFDVLVVDSPVNILSRYGKGKVERISDAYMLLKDFVANKIKRGVLCLVTAQLKQEAIDKLRSKPNETIDVTAGGESAETIRTPDEVIGLFSTKLERSNGQMKIYNVASRHHDTFQDFFVGCHLGSGDFFSKPELNE